GQAPDQRRAYEARSSGHESPHLSSRRIRLGSILNCGPAMASCIRLAGCVNRHTGKWSPGQAQERRRMIPLSAPSYGEREARAVADALNAGRLEGGGVFTRACEARIEAMTGATRVLLTPSCTAALEMAALLSGVGEG